MKKSKLKTIILLHQQAASSVMDLGDNQPQPLLQQPYYQQSNQPNYEQGYTELQQSRAQALVAPSMSYGGMYGSAQVSHSNYNENLWNLILCFGPVFCIYG